MKNNKISVIVTIYNMEKYLDKCIKSILNQTYKNLEIILVNDGSTDKSLDICLKYYEIDKRIIVLNNPNEGVVKVRLAGIKRATGDYITFVDADDWLDSNAYEQVMDMSDDEDIISYGLLEDYSYKSVQKFDQIDEGIYKQVDIKNKILPNIFSIKDFFTFNILPNLVCKLIKREIMCKCVNKVSYYVRIGEDLDFVVQCLSLANILRVIKISPYHYVQREKSVVRMPVGDESVIGLYNDLMSIESDSDNANWQRQVCTYMSFILQLKKMNLFIKKSYFFNELKNKKIVVYGAGNYGHAFVEALGSELGARIEAIADSNWKNVIWKHEKVIAPEDIIKRNYDIIYIAILNERICQTIKSNLINMGIKEDKILYYGIGAVRIDEIKNILKLMQDKLVL